MPRKLHLAVAVYGVGGPGQHGLWKDPRVPKNASIDIGYYIKTAQLAEQALFDALFIVDSQFINPTYPSHYLNRLEPLTLLSAVATHTTRIGLVGTASSTYNSPFNLVRRFASLDLISGGRAGVSEDGRNLAAHVAEGIYAPGGTLAEAQAYFADIKRRAAALGREGRPDPRARAGRAGPGAGPDAAAGGRDGHRVPPVPVHRRAGHGGRRDRGLVRGAGGGRAQPALPHLGGSGKVRRGRGAAADEAGGVPERIRG
jgi:alkanesulfonate monooxygenase SsuD/methylene tetrahydromethanopterin reductase-like flavin-dependent oxidoreductase (luciferase family)